MIGIQRQDGSSGTSGALMAAFAIVTLAAAAVLAYFAIMLVATTDVTIGPVIIEFKVRPAWRGKSIVELPPAGSLRADTHDSPVELVYTLKEISVDRAEELTREDSGEWAALRNWREPVGSGIRTFLFRLTAVATVTAATLAWLILRRWRWTFAGAAVGMAVALGLSWVTWSSYDLDAFAQPEYTGNLAQAPEILDFSQEVIANLDTYSDQVPAIAASLYRTINELQQLAGAAPFEDSIKVLHISDMHGSEAGASLVRRVVDLYAIDFVIDTGDTTELGLPFELDYPKTYLPLDVPYVWIGGNHDNDAVSQAMRGIPGNVVLENSLVEVDTLRIAGFPDPAADSIVPNPATAAELESNGRMALAVLRDNPPLPDIVAVHDPGQALLLGGIVPVVLSGHTHINDITAADGTVSINAGSTGGGGYRGFESEIETPSSLQVLYFDWESHRLLAADTVVIFGFSQEFQVSRKIFAPKSSMAAASG